jgi:hypothetical protein
MVKSIKRLILTGVAVMVMMSFAAPAMANDYGALGPLKLSPADYSFSVPDPAPWDPSTIDPCWVYYVC